MIGGICETSRRAEFNQESKQSEYKILIEEKEQENRINITIFYQKEYFYYVNNTLKIKKKTIFYII